MKAGYFLLVGLSFCRLPSFGQAITPDLQDATQWQVINRKAESFNEDGKKGIRFNEVPDDGLMILHGGNFSDGTIELDIKGSSKMQQSFVGIGFHGKDLKTYDAIYFRPFNFKSDDPVRRSHAVQYISMPNYDWEKLRTAFPGKYEHGIDPAPGPDDWFHAKIVVNGKHVAVFVNNQAQPSLEVDKLNDNSSGGIGLWMGNNSAGSFANLTITPAGGTAAEPAKPVRYGNNPEAGHYYNVGDANIYYEVYGKGKPIVLMHGGIYGYIDEFQPFLDKLITGYQVICIATRGHGKSEIGHSPFSYNQRAEDAYKVIRSITKDSVMVLGFSDGAYGALKLAALHPELVKKLIAIGAGDYALDNKRVKFNYNPEDLMKSDSVFFAGRVALMPEPKRWRESLAKSTKMYNEDVVSTETFSKIQCPALIMAGDRDDYNSTENIVKCAKAIHNAQLSIIPGCHHVVFFCNFPAVWQSIEPFLKQ